MIVYADHSSLHAVLDVLHSDERRNKKDIFCKQSRLSVLFICLLLDLARTIGFSTLSNFIVDISLTFDSIFNLFAAFDLFLLT